MLSVGQAVFLRRLLVLVALMAPVVEAQRGTASAGRTAALIPMEDCHAADTTCVPPPLEREFRGLWVASVSNIDWPSKPGLPVAEVKRELELILDRAQASGLNAVILQDHGIQPAGLRPVEDQLQLALHLGDRQPGLRRPIDVAHRGDPEPTELPLQRRRDTGGVRRMAVLHRDERGGPPRRRRAALRLDHGRHERHQHKQTTQEHRLTD